MAFLHAVPLSRVSRRPRAFQVRGPAPACTRKCVAACASSTRVTSASDNGSRAKAVVDFLRSYGVSDEASERAKSRAPSLLRAGNLDARFRPVHAALTELGLSGRQIARVLTHFPGIVLRSPCDFDARLAFLRHVALIPDIQLPALLARCPHVLIMDVTRASNILREVADACKLDPGRLGDVIARVPQLLLRSPQQLSRNLTWLRENAGLTDAQTLARVVRAVPLVLVYDVARNLQRRGRYLQSLGLDTRGIALVLAAKPDILCCNIENDVEPRIKLITDVVGIDNLVGVLQKVPAILDVPNVEDRLVWFRDDVGLDAAQLASVIRQAPAVLGYSVQGNLAAKWAFVHGTMGGSVDDLVTAPREILCANLQQRAVPRYAFLATRGMLEEVGVVDILRGSDVVFCRRVAKCEAREYREYVDNDRFLLFYSSLV